MILVICPVCQGEQEIEDVNGDGITEVLEEVCSGCEAVIVQERGWCP